MAAPRLPTRMTYYTTGRHVAAFAETYCRHTKGRWASQPLRFEPWQQDMIDEIFLVDDHGRRVYHTVLIGVPRKNGKSSIAAALGLYLLGPDGENEPEVILAAASRDQAGIVYRQAKAYVEANAELQDLFDARQAGIYCPENRGTLKSVSADGKLQHGSNPSGVIVDELHAWVSPKTEELWEALTTGSLAREQPLTVCITTAGHDKGSILGQMYDDALKLPGVERRDGLIIARDREHGFLMWWYEAPEGCDLEDAAAWKMANPASWITAERLNQSLHSVGMKENKFRRLHLNQWTSIDEVWIPPADWAACANPDLRFEPGEQVWIGVDLATKHDNSAVVLAAPTDESRERFKVRAFVFAGDRPTEMVVRVENTIRELGKQYRVMEVSYDPHMFDRSAILLSNEGFTPVEFPQTPQRMGAASQLVYDLVREGRLEHPDDPVLNDHVLSTVAVETERGSFMIKKSKTPRKKKIDASVAMAIAVSRANAAETPAFFLY